MKIIKKIFVAVSLLGLSMTSFASSVGPSSHFSTGTSSGSQGTIYLSTTDGGVTTPVNGVSAGTSIFYDLFISSDSDALVTTSRFTFSGGADDLLVSIFDGIAPVASNTNSVTASLVAGTQYLLDFFNPNTEGVSFSATVSAVPVPAAGLLFASALLGGGALARRKKKAAKNTLADASACVA